MAYNCDVFAIAETWLSNDISDAELFIPGYHIFRQDRDRHGGGVAVYIHDNLPAMLLTPSTPNLELILVKVCYPASPFVVGVYYRPPQNAVSLNSLLNVLESTNPLLLRKAIILGDFNINFLDPNHPLMFQLSTILSSTGLHQIISEPTCYSSLSTGSLPDLILVSDSFSVHSKLVLPPIGSSDHNTIQCFIGLMSTSHDLNRRCHRFLRTKKSIWCLKGADPEKAALLIAWETLLDVSDIDEAWGRWKSKFLEIMSACVPQKCILTRPTVPWLNLQIIRKIRKRNALYRKFKMFENSENGPYWIKYKSLRNEIISDLRKAKANYFSSLCKSSSISSSSWKLIKSLTKSFHVIPDLRVSDEVISDDGEKASAFNSYFSSCFNTSIPPLSFHDQLNQLQSLSLADNGCSEDLLCSPSDVSSIISAWNCKHSNSMGPDGIPITLLKFANHSIASSLCMLLNKSISLAMVPTEWKLANIIPIPKSHHNSSLENYRPISLLSIPGKILEKFISSLMVEFIESQNILSDCQWGFREGRSTCGALLVIVQDWHYFLNMGHEVIVVFFDLRKAFDSVPHVPLLDCLMQFGFDPQLIRWIRNYLTNRKQCVIVNGRYSSHSNVCSGVPQGSVLGPLLFILYIDSVANINFSSGTKLTLFADDLSMTKPLNTEDSLVHLQEDIDKIYEWSSLKHLKFNANKCKFMILSKRHDSVLVLNPPTLLLGGTVLDRVTQFKYLGVIISEDLKWEHHINMVCTKVRRLIDFIYRNLYFHSSPEFLLSIYKSLVRPHLEYCNIVWDPHQKFLQGRLRSVERFGLKVALKCWDWSISYNDLITMAELTPLEIRWIQAKYIFVYKVLYKLAYLPDHLFIVNSARKSRRTNHSLSLTPFSILTYSQLFPT